MRLSDHLPIFAFIGGDRDGVHVQEWSRKRRLVNERRIRGFAEKLEGWSFDEVRAMGVEANVARFRNSFRDLYNEAFPWVEDKRRKRDVEKPWLDDAEFKGLVEEKGVLYSRKLKGRASRAEEGRLVEVSREVNRMRGRLKREYFAQRLEGIKGDLRATWEVLGEVLRGHKGKGGQCVVTLRKMGCQ